MFRKGHTPWNKGNPWSLEMREKISKARKGIGNSPEIRLRMSVSHKGKPLSLGHRQRVSDSLKGRSLSEETKGKISETKRGHTTPWNKGIPRTLEVKQKLSVAFKGQSLELIRGHEGAEKQKARMRLLGLSRKGKSRPDLVLRNNDPEFTRRKFIGLNLKPNKYEKKVIVAIKESNLPYRFVGDGSVILGRLCPDFINTDGAKIVLEVFGELFHDPIKGFKNIREAQTEEGRREVFGKLGFKMIVLWGNEVKSMSTEQIAQRILELQKAPKSLIHEHERG